MLAKKTALAALISVAAYATLTLPAAAAVGDTFAAFEKGATRTVDHSAWTELLAKYVVASPDGVNRVAYAKMKAEGHPAVKAYVKSLEAVAVTKLDRPEQFAFWANLYNAKTIDVVLENYPTKSIKDIRLGGGLLAIVTGGPWKAKVTKVEGVELSLDDIEHGILRPVFKDPRVHYAVNCASIGCPNLPREAFTGAKLEQQLDAGARSYVNHPRGLRVEDGKVHASSIYSWFQVDFGGSAEGVLAHARKFAAPPLLEKLKGLNTIDSYGYDWGLNDRVTP